MLSCGAGSIANEEETGFSGLNTLRREQESQHLLQYLQPALAAQPAHMQRETTAQQTRAHMHTRMYTGTEANLVLTNSDICKIIFAVLFPPLGVFLEVGCTGQLCLNIVFTICGKLCPPPQLSETTLGMFSGLYMRKEVATW